MIRSFLKTYHTGFVYALRELNMDQVSRIVNLIFKAYKQRRKILIVGNGGSAATASHFVCDLCKTAMLPGLPPVRAISLSDNIPLVTAYGNDMGYEHIFSEQVAILADPGDLLVVISGSGNSPNILRALTTAGELGLTTAGLLGFGGGQALELCDEAVVLSSTLYGPVEDIHMFITHSIADCLKQLLLFDKTAEKVDQSGVCSVAAN